MNSTGITGGGAACASTSAILHASDHLNEAHDTVRALLMMMLHAHEPGNPFDVDPLDVQRTLTMVLKQLASMQEAGDLLYATARTLAGLPPEVLQ